ncbi:MAG: SDR family oxidoreductase, partial [Spongiibacteraceae bacterium]|nr:SDR family oxidoreductase [Spongiibacteraceae bacterium]
MSLSLYSDLKGASIFITGGGSGIGAAFVRSFIRQGANVSFVSLDGDNAEALCDQIEGELGTRPFFQQCDICDIDHMQSCIAKAEEKYSSADVLINNAARDTRHALEEFTPQQWDDSLNTNLRPHFFSAQAVAAGMKKNKLGSIINVSSNSALLGLSGYPAYVSAKAGIIGLSKALARELGPHNIRVNALIPGWVMTERQKRLWVTPEA